MIGERNGLFITLEGIDGAGKSTQAVLLADWLAGQGLRVVATREPGGAPGAEQIRELLVTGAPGRWSAEAELLLFTAARRDHVERLIAPALADGAVVVCDRYVDSTRAYQAGDPALAEAVDWLHRHMIGLDPDLTLLFDVDPDAALARAADRDPGGAEDRFERRGAAFQQTLRARFRRIAEAEPSRVRVIDAGGAAASVAAQVRSAVKPALADL